MKSCCPDLSKAETCKLFNIECFPGVLKLYYILSLSLSCVCCTTKGLFVNTTEAHWLSHLVVSYSLTVIHFSLPCCRAASSRLHSFCRPYSSHVFQKFESPLLQGHFPFSQVISREIFSGWTVTLCLGLSMSHTPVRTVSILPSVHSGNDWSSLRTPHLITVWSFGPPLAPFVLVWVLQEVDAKMG